MGPRTRLFGWTLAFGLAAALAGAACGGSGNSASGGSGGSSSTTTGTSTVTSTGTSSGCDPSSCPDPGTACLTPACSAAGACTTTNAAAGTACTDHGGKVCDGNGSCVACAQASDCSPPTTTCVTATCAAGSCGTTNSAEGSACTDGGGKVCDGNGSCVQCLGDADCTGGATCDTMTDTCVTASCTDGMKDGEETDVDCGGAACDAMSRTCAVGKACMVGADCQSQVCTGDVCQAPTCSDGVQNGTETDVDCGGATCDATGHTCGVGKRCLTAADCANGLCDATNHCPAPTCTDGVKNGGETGIDCGNSAVTGCPACPAGQGCAAGADCQSLHCSNGVCLVASCSDGLQNGGESDVDCGHVCVLKLCGNGKKCVANDDCSSNTCLGGFCYAATCNDGAKDGSETDVDCGGTCPKCGPGKGCTVNADCASGTCLATGKCM
jgi:hypothetical protein